MKDDMARLKPKLPTQACRDNGIKMDVVRGPPKHFQFSYQVPRAQQDFQVSWTVVYSACNLWELQISLSWCDVLTHFSPMFSFLYPLKSHKNQRFSEVYRG